MQVRVSTDKLSHTFFSRQQLQSASHIFSAVLEKLANPWPSEADRERALKAWNIRDAARRPPRTDSSVFSVYFLAGFVFTSLLMYFMHFYDQCHVVEVGFASCNFTCALCNCNAFAMHEAGCQI
jgi:hypothetical protein